MNGIYRIYEDGKLIREVKNKLTLLGRSNALSTMLGLTQSFAGSLGIGISSASNGTNTFLNMTDLDYGVGKYPVTSSSLGQDSSQTKDALVYTARITDPSRYSIYELGLFSNQIAGSVDVDALSLLSFESGDSLKETVSSVDYYLDDTYNSRKATYEIDNINYRIGSNAVKLETGGSIFINDSVFNLTNFYPPDKLKLAFYATGTSVVVEVKFYSGANNNAKFTFNSGAGVVNNAYNIVSLLKSQATITGTMDWSVIDRIEVTVSGGTNAILDGLRIEKTKPIDSIDGLVSRAVLDSNTKIEKQAGSIIDIEYLLSFDLDAG
jgi:hypothetical protein